jgi:hypothetical protein
VTWEAEVYDTDSMHDTASNTSRITFNTAGLYELDWLVTLGSGTSTYTQLDFEVRLNAAGNPAGGSTVRGQPFPVTGRGQTPMKFHRFMSAGDHLEAWITQTSGGSQTASSASLGTRVFARWIASS